MQKKLKIVTVASADRECGIAIYDAMHRDELAKCANDIEWVKVAAIDNLSNIEHNPQTTLTTIVQNDVDSWRTAAETISHEADIVHIQHEHGLNDSSFRGYSILAEELRKRKIPVVATFHTWEFNPPKQRKQDTESTIANTDAVVALNRIAVSAIIRKNVYGRIPASKLFYSPHPARDIDISPQKRDELQKMLGLEGKDEKQETSDAKRRIVSVSLGLMSPDKGTDKMIEGLCIAWTNKNILPEEFRPRVLHLCLGDYHPGYKSWKDGKPCDEFDAHLKKTLDSHGIPFKEFPGMKEFIETDLSRYFFVFVKHFLAENEFRNSIALPHIAIITNQKYEQIASGPCAEFATSRPLVASRQLCTEEYLFQIPPQQRKKIRGVEERDSGWLIELGKGYSHRFAQAYAEAVCNEEKRNWREIQAMSKRPECTWSHLTKKMIKELYQQL